MSVQKYEYCIIILTKLHDGFVSFGSDPLIEAGKEGWELIKVIATTDEQHAYLKRPLETSQKTSNDDTGEALHERIIKKISARHEVHPTQVSILIVGELVPVTTEEPQKQAWTATARANSHTLKQSIGQGDTSSKALADLLCCVQKELEETMKKHADKAIVFQQAINL